MSQNETGRFDTNLSSETAKILRSTGLSCSKGGYRYPLDKLHPADSAIDFPNTYQLDSDLSSG